MALNRFVGWLFPDHKVLATGVVLIIIFLLVWMLEHLQVNRRAGARGLQRSYGWPGLEALGILALGLGFLIAGFFADH